MSATHIGLITGLALGIAAAVGGFTGFLVALVLGAVGLAVGRYLDGELGTGGVFGHRESHR